VEYGLAGVPWLASAGIVYEKLDGHGGHCVQNTPEAWFAALEEMILNLAQYKRASAENMAWARDNLTMVHKAADYVAVFDRIMADKNVRIKARMPNVFYAKEIFDEVQEITNVNVQRSDDDNLAVLTDYQSKTYAAVDDWLTGLAMRWNEIDVGRCLQYPLLHELNERVFVGLREEEPAVSEAEPNLVSEAEPEVTG